MDDKTKKYLDSLITEIEGAKERVSKLEIERKFFEQDLSRINDDSYDWLLQEMIKTFPKQAYTTENWEKMFDDMAELCRIADKAKLSYTMHSEYGYIPTSFRIDDVLLDHDFLQAGDVVKLGIYHQATADNPFMTLHVGGTNLGIGIMIAKDVPYSLIKEGTVVVNFDQSALLHHLVGNWNAIYARAVERMEGLLRMERGALCEKELQLKAQIKECKRAVKEHFAGKTEEEREDR